MPNLNTSTIAPQVLAKLASAYALDNAGLYLFPKIAPAVSVSALSGKYEQFPIGASVPYSGLNMERALHAVPMRYDVGSTLVDFTLKEYSGLVMREQEREINYALQGGLVNPMSSDLRKLVNNLQAKQEITTLALFTDSTVTNTTTISAAADKWDVYATSDPIGNVETLGALITVDSNAELEHLSGTCTSACFRTLRNHPKIIAKFAGAVTMENLTEQQVAHALGIKELSVSAAGVLSATDVRSSMHPNAFNLYLASADAQRVEMGEAAFAQTLTYKGGISIQTEKDVKTDDMIEVAKYFVLPVIKNAGQGGRIITPLS